MGVWVRGPLWVGCGQLFSFYSPIGGSQGDYLVGRCSVLLHPRAGIGLFFYLFSG